MDSVTKALMSEFSRANSTDDLPEDKQFEHFAAYSVVSSRYSDDFDTDDLVTGSGGDLNVDAFAVKINGRLASDAEFVADVLEMNGYLDVEFIIIQAKTSSNFDGAAIIALGDNLAKEVFADTQNLPVSDDVKRLIQIKDKVFENASKLRDNPVCRVFYVCTGNWNEDTYLVEAIKRKRQDLIDTNLFSEVYFEPIGARPLQRMFRDTKSSISREIRFERLVTLPTISDVAASYLGVLPADEFLKLISDEDDNIVKSVFVDNVRDFQGENAVNKDIAKTIQDGLFDQFVIRNNGITIVAHSIRVTSNQFTLDDYQIVNGCQTSHVIYANRAAITGDLYVPVKLIHTGSEEVSQSIIKSTNKQTRVEESDLLALTQFQRDLEDFFAAKPNDTKLYYERRAKQYASRSDIEKGRITPIGSQLKSYASMFLEVPNQAGRYQGTLLKTVKDQVFQPNHKPEPYYTSAFAFYRFEVAIRRLTGDDRWIRPFRFYLLLAFRHRYEEADYPGPSNRRVGEYCDPLNAILADQNRTREAFDECRRIIEEGLAKLSLPNERDSAKSRPLIEATKEIACARKLALAEAASTPSA